MKNCNGKWHFLLTSCLTLLTTVMPWSWSQESRAQRTILAENSKRPSQHLGPKDASGSPNGTNTSAISLRLTAIDDLISDNRLADAKQIIRVTLSAQPREQGMRKTEKALLLLYKGVVDYLLGDGLNAEKAYEQALQELAKAKDVNTGLEIMALNNLASLYLTDKKYDIAANLLSRALEIGSVAPHKNRILIGITLNGMGYHAMQTRQPAEARRLLTEAIQYLSTSNDNPRHLLAAINNLYMLELSEKNYVDAATLLETLQGLHEQWGKISEPELATYYYNSAAFYYYHKKSEEMVLSFTRLGLSAQRRHLIAQLPRLARGKRVQFFNSVRKRGEAAEWLYWWSESFPGANALSIETSLNSKGFIQELGREQAIILRSGSNLNRLTSRLEALNTEYSSVRTGEYRRREILDETDRLQEELYSSFRPPDMEEVTISEVSTALPPDGALIEIQKYRSFLGDFSADGKQWGDYRYSALILKADRSVTMVQLGPAEPIETAIQQALNATAQNTNDDTILWGKVSDLILKPLALALAGSNQWFLSPDAELNRVPFSALPSPQDPRTSLSQAIQLRLLTTGRDLLRLQRPPMPAKAPVMIANPNFNRSLPNTNLPGLTTSAQVQQSRTAELVAKVWSPLPASQLEGQLIGTLLSTKPITGAAATTLRLQQLNAPLVLHIASHGFFVGDEEPSDDTSLNAIQAQSSQLFAFRGEDLQLRSGLVLAGANQPAANPNDDGYLTAAEAVTLKLEGTELVVLSACSTGQGDIRTGEGVYGLQRSLTVAGARSTLLSLWKVDDAATAEFMVRFYRRLKAGEGRADALAAVQAEFRSGSVRGPRGENWSPPYFWAAWQLVGDWRPIRGL